MAPLGVALLVGAVAGGFDSARASGQLQQATAADAPGGGVRPRLNFTTCALAFVPVQQHEHEAAAAVLPTWYPPEDRVAAYASADQLDDMIRRRKLPATLEAAVEDWATPAAAAADASWASAVNRRLWEAASRMQVLRGAGYKIGGAVVYSCRELRSPPQWRMSDDAAETKSTRGESVREHARSPAATENGDRAQPSGIRWGKELTGARRLGFLPIPRILEIRLPNKPWICLALVACTLGIGVILICVRKVPWQRDQSFTRLPASIWGDALLRLRSSADMWLWAPGSTPKQETPERISVVRTSAPRLSFAILPSATAPATKSPAGPMSGVVSTALEVVAVLAATHLAARLVAGDGSMVVVYNSAHSLQLISVLVLVIGLWLWSGLFILLGAKHDAPHVGHGISKTQRGPAGTRHRLDGLARWYLISCPLPTIVLSIASLLENQFCFCAGMYGYGVALWALGMLALRGGWVGALKVHAGKQPADAGGPLLRSSLMNPLSDGRHPDDVNRETASQRYCAAFAYRSKRGILARLCGAAVLLLRCGGAPGGQLQPRKSVQPTAKGPPILLAGSGEDPKGASGQETPPADGSQEPLVGALEGAKRTGNSKGAGSGEQPVEGSGKVGSVKEVASEEMKEQQQQEAFGNDMQDLESDEDLKMDPTVWPMWDENIETDATVEIAAALNSKKHTAFGLGKKNENAEDNAKAKSFLSDKTGSSPEGARLNLQRVGLSGAQHVYNEKKDANKDDFDQSKFEREARLDFDVERDAIRYRWMNFHTLGGEKKLHIKDHDTLSQAAKTVATVAKELAPAIFFARYVGRDEVPDCIRVQMSPRGKAVRLNLLEKLKNITPPAPLPGNADGRGSLGAHLEKLELPASLLTSGNREQLLARVSKNLEDQLKAVGADLAKQGKKPRLLTREDVEDEIKRVNTPDADSVSLSSVGGPFKLEAGWARDGWSQKNMEYAAADWHSWARGVSRGVPTGEVANRITTIVERVGKVARKMLHSLERQKLDTSEAWPPVRPVFGSLARALVVNSFSVLKDVGDDDDETALQLESTVVRMYMETTAKRVEALMWRMVQPQDAKGQGGTLRSMKEGQSCGTASNNGVEDQAVTDIVRTICKGLHGLLTLEFPDSADTIASPQARKLVKNVMADANMKAKTWKLPPPCTEATVRDQWDLADKSPGVKFVTDSIKIPVPTSGLAQRFTQVRGRVLRDWNTQARERPYLEQPRAESASSFSEKQTQPHLAPAPPTAGEGSAPSSAVEIRNAAGIWSVGPSPGNSESGSVGAKSLGSGRTRTAAHEYEITHRATAISNHGHSTSPQPSISLPASATPTSGKEPGPDTLMLRRERTQGREKKEPGDIYGENEKQHHVGSNGSAAESRGANDQRGSIQRREAAPAPPSFYDCVSAFGSHNSHCFSSAISNMYHQHATVCTVAVVSLSFVMAMLLVYWKIFVRGRKELERNHSTVGGSVLCGAPGASGHLTTYGATSLATDAEVAEIADEDAPAAERNEEGGKGSTTTKTAATRAETPGAVLKVGHT